MCQRWIRVVAVVTVIAGVASPRPSFAVSGGSCCPTPWESGWFTAEYIHWWVQGDHVPALLTTSPPLTLADEFGVLGAPGTETLFGDELISDEGRPGVRLSMGRWLDDGCDWALAGEFFWVAEDVNDFSVFSDGNPGLARPFFNTDPNVNGPDSQLIAFNDPIDGEVVDGGIAIDTSSDIYSANLDVYRALLCSLQRRYGYRIDALAGYRFFRLDENLRITESLIATGSGGSIAQGTTVDIVDEFGTSNEFHGFEFGAKTQCYHGVWVLDALVKLGVGNNRQRLRIGGQTDVVVPDEESLSTPGGLLIQESNSGVHERDSFALLPELQLNLARQLSDYLEVRVGYTLLFLTDVVRPGSTIDPQVDGRFLDPFAPSFTASSPAAAFNESSIWLQGVNIGMTLHY